MPSDKYCARNDGRVAKVEDDQSRLRRSVIDRWQEDSAAIGQLRGKVEGLTLRVAELSAANEAQRLRIEDLEAAK